MKKRRPPRPRKRKAPKIGVAANNNVGDLLSSVASGAAAKGGVAPHVLNRRLDQMERMRPATER